MSTPAIADPINTRLKAINTSHAISWPLSTKTCLSTCRYVRLRKTGTLRSWMAEYAIRWWHAYIHTNVILILLTYCKCWFWIALSCKHRATLQSVHDVCSMCTYVTLYLGHIWALLPPCPTAVLTAAKCLNRQCSKTWMQYILHSQTGKTHNGFLMSKICYMNVRALHHPG